MEPSNKRSKINRLKKAYNKATKLNTDQLLYAMHQLDILKHLSEFDERWSYGENCLKCDQKNVTHSIKKSTIYSCNSCNYSEALKFIPNEFEKYCKFLKDNYPDFYTQKF